MREKRKKNNEISAPLPTSLREEYEDVRTQNLETCSSPRNESYSANSRLSEESSFLATFDVQMTRFKAQICSQIRSLTRNSDPQTTNSFSIPFFTPFTAAEDTKCHICNAILRLYRRRV